MSYTVDKVDFIKMYQKARVKTMTSANIKFALIKSGLLPLNPAIVLEKLPSRNPRLSTPPELRLTSSDKVLSFALSFTPSNSAEVDVLIHRIAKHNNKDLQTFKKLAKACTSAIARSQCQETTNKTLLEVAERQHEKITRTKDYYGDARVMNNEVLEERAQLAVSKAARKAKDKSNKEMNQVIKAFMRLDSMIFAESKHRSPKKKNITANSSTGNSSTGNSSTKSIFQLPPISESSIPGPPPGPLSGPPPGPPSGPPPGPSVSAKLQRRRAPKPKSTLEQQSQALIPPQSSRSGRLIRP